MTKSLSRSLASKHGSLMSLVARLADGENSSLLVTLIAIKKRRNV
jgi:hypothetical protein